MNYLICKCDKNQAQEDVSLSNLLNIKNLEKSLKNNELNMLKSDNAERNNNEKESSSNYELEIIEYPINDIKKNDIK